MTFKQHFPTNYTDFNHFDLNTYTIDIRYIMKKNFRFSLNTDVSSKNLIFKIKNYSIRDKLSWINF